MAKNTPSATTEAAGLLVSFGNDDANSYCIYKRPQSGQRRCFSLLCFPPFVQRFERRRFYSCPYFCILIPCISHISTILVLHFPGVQMASIFYFSLFHTPFTSRFSILPVFSIYPLEPFSANGSPVLVLLLLFSRKIFQPQYFF